MTDDLKRLIAEAERESRELDAELGEVVSPPLPRLAEFINESIGIWRTICRARKPQSLVFSDMESRIIHLHRFAKSELRRAGFNCDCCLDRRLALALKWIEHGKAGLLIDLERDLANAQMRCPRLERHLLATLYERNRNGNPRQTVAT